MSEGGIVEQPQIHQLRQPAKNEGNPKEQKAPEALEPCHIGRKVSKNHGSVLGWKAAMPDEPGF